MTIEKIPGTKAIAQRMINAEANFDETLTEIAGLSASDAATVRRFYLKNKIAKMDAVVGRISVKHGAYMDRDVIIRAKEMAQ